MSEEKITIITNRVEDATPIPPELGTLLTEGLFCDSCNEPVVLTDSTFPHLSKPHELICTRCAKGMVGVDETVNQYAADPRFEPLMEEVREELEAYLRGEDVPKLAPPDSL